jgi:CHAT domain-containing protein
MPAALLAFANDRIENKPYLRNLVAEAKAIERALAKAGLDILSPIHEATVPEVIQAFRDHRNEIRVFHFGGHANGSALLFEGDAGQPTKAHADGLASYLGAEPGLVLVFLNACSTKLLVQRLRAAGVRAVVGTTQLIKDSVAAEFAAAFYAELATRSLREAFNAAVSLVRRLPGDKGPRNVRDVTRDVVPQDKPREPSWPWTLDCDPNYENWTLDTKPSDADGRPGLRPLRTRDRFRHLVPRVVAGGRSSWRP